MGILIEHYAGAFPYWLAPVQVKIIPINDSHVDYAAELKTEFMNWGLRVEVDTRSEKLGGRFVMLRYRRFHICSWSETRRKRLILLV